MRVVSWNVNFPGSKRAAREGAMLRGLRPALVLLQEVNPNSASILSHVAGADSMVRADELPSPEPGSLPTRRHVAAVAGYGVEYPHHHQLLDGVLQPWRTLLIATRIGGTEIFAASYHAPPGVRYGITKPRQAVAFASWLNGHRGPVLFGADANTPLADALDFASTRTHWHTGDRHLHGEPGDDLLFGPGKKHTLGDALRRWIAEHPDHAAAFRANSLQGPLATTHRTGRRKDNPGTGRRFDSVWISSHWTVRNIEHLYDDGIAAGSDHALVVADLDLQPGCDERTSQQNDHSGSRQRRTLPGPRRAAPFSSLQSGLYSSLARLRRPHKW